MQIKQISAGGVQQNISGSNLKQIYVAVPPMQEQEKIAVLIKSGELAEQMKSKKLSRCLDLKKGLMQDLLTGKVRVKV
jgi:type I restriction enzyme, S subunit